MGMGNDKDCARLRNYSVGNDGCPVFYPNDTVVRAVRFDRDAGVHVTGDGDFISAGNALVEVGDSRITFCPTFPDRRKK